ncbi:MAG: 50S ribosomal protein L37ae [Candidatus Thermoplasmatota archaeon]|nr:50S ribosomal protein L37ae [Candidatus Thermoplasmatota archaeon]MDI6855398.1 50S ribosomal protein L37ae [Candidatus Thermoplasmatota archaeon]MDI6887613.1 50S ribosomal protein L37ae [Candidatus Thermoplasmatota archaeon]
MSAAKKVGSVARFGARYGVSVRLRVKDIEQKTRSKYLCPSCNYIAVKRLASGIWKCRHCNTKFAGAAYTPITMAKVEEEQERK